MTHLLNGISKRVSTAAAILGSLTTFALALSITIDVLIRLLTGQSLVGMVELSETLLVALVFLGMSYTAYVGGHVAMTLLTEHLPERVKGWTRAVAYLLVLALLVWLAYATAGRAVDSFVSGEYKFGLSRFPMWPARWAIVIGLVASIPVVMLRLVLAVRAGLGRAPLTDVPGLERGGSVEHAV